MLMLSKVQANHAFLLLVQEAGLEKSEIEMGLPVPFLFPLLLSPFWVSFLKWHHACIQCICMPWNTLHRKLALGNDQWKRFMDVELNRSNWNLPTLCFCRGLAVMAECYCCYTGYFRSHRNKQWWSRSYAWWTAPLLTLCIRVLTLTTFDCNIQPEFGHETSCSLGSKYTLNNIHSQLSAEYQICLKDTAFRSCSSSLPFVRSSVLWQLPNQYLPNAKLWQIHPNADWLHNFIEVFSANLFCYPFVGIPCNRKAIE